MSTVVALFILFCSGFLAYIRPRYALYLIGCTLPLYTIRGTIGTIPVTALELIILGSVGIILTVHARKSLYKDMSTLLLWAGAFLYITTLACIAAPELNPALGIWKAYCVEPILCAIAARMVFRNQKHWEMLWLSCISAGVIVALIAIVQYFTFWGVPAPWNTANNIRSTAFYGYPNAVGLFLAPLTVLSINAAIYTSHIRRLIYIITSVVLFLGILAARADGAIVSVIAAGCVLLYCYKKRATLLSIAIIGAIIITTSETVRSILTFHDTSGEVRRALWYGTLNLLTHSPFFGAGLAHFADGYEQHRLASHVELLEYAHNIFLDMWAQFGILGLLWFCALLIWGAIHIKRSATPIKYMATALCTAFLVYGLVDVPYFKNDLAVLAWMIVAYISMLPRSKARVQNAACKS